jgi:hypothetical protein
MRSLIAVFLAGATLVLFSATASAQDPGVPSDASVELRKAPGGEVQVVVRWSPSVNPDADYLVWRRTPWDVSYQMVEPYADVPASSRLPDGSYEFVDPEPFSMPDRPCYMVSATLGEPPERSALPGCIPTLPGAMRGLALTALPGPYPDSWYITGRGFAPGASIELHEQNCPAVPCPGARSIAATRVEAAIDGRFAAFAQLPQGPPEGTRRIVAFERGWLPSQLAVAPPVEVEAAYPGTAAGHPISTRTGEPAVDRVLEVLASGDPVRFGALLQFRELPALDGRSTVRGLPKVTCGNGDGLVAEREDEPVATYLNALVSEFFGLHIYAVFRIAHAPGEWRAFETATNAIVLAFAQDGYHPRAAVLAVNESGVVGVGQVCGAAPPYYLRGVDSFVLSPVTTPLAPATGTGASAPSQGPNRDYRTAGFAMLAASALLWLETVRRRRRV